MPKEYGWGSISELPEVIIIGVPRTASGSMQDSFNEHPGVIMLNTTARNVVADGLKKKYGQKWDSAFTFAFVRNPIDRFASAYATTMPGGCKTTEEAMEYNPTIFIPMCVFINEPLDFIGRYENIQKDWKKMTEMIGVDVKLLWVNRGPKKPKLNKKQVEFVKDYYKEDFKRFNY